MGFSEPNNAVEITFEMINYYKNCKNDGKLLAMAACYCVGIPIYHFTKR